MGYISVIQFAGKYGISERTVRNYCAKDYRRTEAVLLPRTEPMGAYERLSDGYLPHRARPLQSVTGLFPDNVSVRTYHFY